MDTKITYINFWPKFRANKFWLHKHINTNKNIIISSVFLKKKNIDQLLSQKSKDTTLLLYSFENLYHPNHVWLTNYLSEFDLILGINDIILPNYIRISYTLHFDVDIKNNIVDNKSKNLCMIASNNAFPRSELVRKLLAKNIRVDCGGQLMNNIGYRIDSKHDFMLDYYFNICPENSYAKGYCTEKIYESLQANCLPIYWGDLSCDSDIINTNKILYIQPDFSNIDAIIDRCVYLLQNKDELNALLNQETFNITNSKNQNRTVTDKISKFLQLQ